MKKWLLGILLISTTVLAQDFTNRDEFATRARSLSRMTNDTFSVNNTDLWLFLTMAAKETDNKLRPNEAHDTIWTVAGTSTYALNNDCYFNGVVSVRVLLDSASGLYQACRSILTRDQGQQVVNTQTGAPLWYSTYGKYLKLEPTPLETYRVEIEYEGRSTPFGTLASDSTDSISTINPEYDYLILDYARYLILKRLNLDAEAATALQEWKTNVAEERALLQKQPDPLVSPQAERGK